MSSLTCCNETWIKSFPLAICLLLFSFALSLSLSSGVCLCVCVSGWLPRESAVSSSSPGTKVKVNLHLLHDERSTCADANAAGELNTSRLQFPIHIRVHLFLWEEGVTSVLRLESAFVIPNNRGTGSLSRYFCLSKTGWKITLWQKSMGESLLLWNPKQWLIFGTNWLQQPGISFLARENGKWSKHGRFVFHREMNDR